MITLTCDDDIAAAVEGLLAVEPRFASVVKTHGLPSLRRMDQGLEGLLRIVTDQLISLKAGEAIWRRIEVELKPFDAATIARKREASLMRLGLSGAKARCFKAVANAVADGSFSFERLDTLPDSNALQALMALKGIGPWTADIYLLAAMGRADAWPAGDLAVQVGAQHLFAIPERPDLRRMAELAEPLASMAVCRGEIAVEPLSRPQGMGQAIT